MDALGLHVRLLVLVSLTWSMTAAIDVYEADYAFPSNSDLSSVTWMKAASAGSSFKVITPDKGSDAGCRTFIKVRAFLSRNINLTIHIHSGANETIKSWAMTDSNIPGDSSSDIWSDVTYDYLENKYYNYTLSAMSTINHIPLWTGEAFYIESTGDLSGTFIHQPYETEKTLMEVVTGGAGCHIGNNLGTMMPGFSIDATPAAPKLWGSVFLTPIMPAALFDESKGYSVKYVTYYPNQIMKTECLSGDMQDSYYDGIGAGRIDMTTNEPCEIKTDHIAHVMYFTWSSTTIPSAMAQVVDSRSGTDWYSFDVSGFQNLGRGVEMWVEAIIPSQFYKPKKEGETALWVEEISIGGGPVQFEDVGTPTEFCGHTFAIHSLATDVTTQVYTSPNIVNFVVFMFAKCSDNTCAMASAMESAQTNEIDFTEYDDEEMPTSDPNNIGTAPPPEVTSPASQVSTTSASVEPTVTVGPPGTDKPITGEPTVTVGPPGTDKPITGEPTVTVGPGEGTSKAPIPPELIENPFTPECPCLLIEDLQYHDILEGTYLRLLHNEGASMEELEVMLTSMYPSMEMSFGVDNGYVEFNGKPVWKHPDCDIYLFWHDGEVSYWLLGPELGASKGFMLNYDQVKIPESVQLNLPWKFETADSWVEDDLSTTECTCKEVEDEILYFESTTYDYDYEGYYYLYGSLNEHNVYRHLNHTYYLYYYKDPAGNSTCELDEYWAIGEYLGGSGPYAFVRDAIFAAGKIGGDGLADWILSSGDWSILDPWSLDLTASVVSLDSFEK